MDSNSQDEATSRNSLQDKSNGQTLIQLEGVTKVFITEEVETHALAGIHLSIAQGGEYVSIAGPSGCGKSTLMRFSACSTRPPKANTGWAANRWPTCPPHSGPASATGRWALSSRL